MVCHPCFESWQDRMTANPTYRILIVDDEPTVADTLCLILKSQGYETAVAYDAESALVKAGTFVPDIVIADVMLPGMNGIEFAILIGQAQPTCIVLIMSGHPGTADIISTAEGQGHVFPLLAKPFPPAELLERVSSILSAN